MQSVFAAAYDDVARAFTSVFPILFPGGQGSISLTNPDDLLTTGVDVMVKPAGKKIDRLSLLSGGEQSLTAVAFLVALFKARPSPFYILDEVEAAFLRSPERFVRLHHAEHLAVVADYADFGHANALIDSDLRSPLSLSRVEASHCHVWFRCLLQQRVSAHPALSARAIARHEVLVKRPWLAPVGGDNVAQGACTINVRAKSGRTLS
jgi:hypothetical protein